jgi:hypothetical protein
MPDISCYGNCRSGNYGMHTLAVDFGVVTIWYSYVTPVAFQLTFGPLVVHENVWGRTTGKHLGWIDNGRKEDRVSEEEFQAQWQRQVAPYFDEDAAIDAARAESLPNEPLDGGGDGRSTRYTRKLLKIPKLKLTGM